MNDAATNPEIALRATFRGMSNGESTARLSLLAASGAMRTSCTVQQDYKHRPDKRQSVSREASAGKSAPILGELQPGLCDYIGKENRAMAKTYQVWTHIAEFNDETGEYQDITEPCDVAEFDHEQDAHEFIKATIGNCRDCGDTATRFIQLCKEHYEKGA